MLLLGLFVAELIFLLILSQFLSKTVSRLLYLIFKRTSVVIHVLSFLFLPGVILHELSHLLVANILLVPTGEVEFFPEIHGDEVKMGSVAIGRTDPFRRFLIGVAPFLGGILIIFILCTFFYPTAFLSWQTLLLLYALFQIVNTMFSSRKDMEGALGLFIAVAILVLLALLLKIPLLPVLQQVSASSQLQQLLGVLNWYLGIAIGLDLVVIVCTKTLLILRK